MRGLQRSPHVTTTMEFPAESTLVSILYLQQPEHPAGGSPHCTGRLYGLYGRAGSVSTAQTSGATTGVS